MGDFLINRPLINQPREAAKKMDLYALELNRNYQSHFEEPKYQLSEQQKTKGMFIEQEIRTPLFCSICSICFFHC